MILKIQNRQQKKNVECMQWIGTEQELLKFIEALFLNHEVKGTKIGNTNSDAELTKLFNHFI